MARPTFKLVQCKRRGLANHHHQKVEHSSHCQEFNKLSFNHVAPFTYAEVGKNSPMV